MKVKNNSVKKVPAQANPTAVVSLPENMIPVQTRSLNSIIFNGDSYGSIDKNFRSSRMLNPHSTLNYEHQNQLISENKRLMENLKKNSISSNLQLAQNLYGDTHGD